MNIRKENIEMKKTLIIVVLVLALMVSTAVVAFAADQTVYLYPDNPDTVASQTIFSISAQAYGYSYTDATIGTKMYLQCNYQSGTYYNMGNVAFGVGSSGRISLRNYDNYPHKWRIRLYPNLGLGAHSFGTVYN